MQFHDELNAKIWQIDNNNEIKPEVADKLKEIADAFIESLEIPLDAVVDVVITGSSASYNYTKYSDIDLHLKVNFDKVHEDCPIVKGYLNALKAAFNKNHDIYIYGVPVEVYAEGINEDTVHNGLYSLWQAKWLDIPQKIPPTDNDAAVKAKYSEIAEQIDTIKDSELATLLLERIYDMRKAGLADAGEFSTENLAFKKLRDEGYLDKLREIKKEQVDKKLSLEKRTEDLDEDDDYEYDETDSEQCLMHKLIYWVNLKSGNSLKHITFHVYQDDMDDTYNELCDRHDNQIGLYSTEDELHKQMELYAKQRIDAHNKQGLDSWEFIGIEFKDEDMNYYNSRNKYESKIKIDSDILALFGE